MDKNNLESFKIANKITGTAIDYTHDGRGVIKYQNMPIFVPNLLVGEKADVEILVNKKTYYEGKVLHRYNDSKERIVPPCKFYEECGGCQLQHFSYKEQLKMKKIRVAEVLRRIGGYNGKIQDCIPSPSPYYYRTKTQMPFGYGDKGQLIAGFYTPKTHTIIDIDHCLIENKTMSEVMFNIKNLMKKYRFEPYNINKNKGWLRYLMLRHGLLTNETLVTFVTGPTFFPKKEEIIQTILKENPSVKTIVQNINDKKTNVVLGEKEKILYGPGYIYDEIEGLKFKISPKSFFQVNPLQTKALYQKAIQYADLKGHETVLDAYCGVGTISLLTAKYVKKVIGVEIVIDAIKNAQENAQINQIKNAEFYVQDAAKFLKAYPSSFDAIFVDPPRNGLSEEFIQMVLEKKPQKFIYISCEPSSLARDLKILQSIYQVKEVQPVDMFSQTYHVETITLLSLKTALKNHLINRKRSI